MTTARHMPLLRSFEFFVKRTGYKHDAPTVLAKFLPSTHCGPGILHAINASGYLAMRIEQCFSCHWLG
jgi:hypothetical protein